MSYILDALRRADSERERGSVPGLHSQQMAPVSPDARPTPSARPWPWIVTGLSLGLMIPLAWLALSRVEPRAPATPAVEPPPAVAMAPTTPAAPVPAPPPAPVVEPAPAPIFEQPVTPPPPPVAPTAPAPAAPTPVAAPTAATPAAPPAPPAGARIHAQHELPDDVRRSLPALQVGGSVYSSNPRDRLLILNGRPFQEGESPAPEVTLEEIRLKSAVLRYRNHRYTINY